MPETEVEKRLRELESVGKRDDERLKGIESRLGKIESNINNMMWVIITAIVGAATTVIFNLANH